MVVKDLVDVLKARLKLNRALETFKFGPKSELPDKLQRRRLADQSIKIAQVY